MNRLRSHFIKQAAQKPTKRLQSAIVADYHNDIISLIADDGATLDEVADAVRAQGEPILDYGFKAEVLKQIGTVKAIRAGAVSKASIKCPSEPVATSQPLAVPPRSDIDEDFMGRRRRT